ncbi:MAG: hypothetical protein NC417_12540 [Candidatus Gastranaerophilales bacterium]|nr:hypothetical protein [Candidatus Gastranaerophilales bacterium]
MAEQDISTKVMLYHNDVFSDVINGLIFEKPYIDESKLKDVIPESAYEDFDGNLRSMERDLLKAYGEGDEANYFAIAEFGIGNQTTVDPTIPVRVMGYDYTVYKRQLDEYNNKKRNLYRLLKDAQEIGSAELVKRVQKDIEKLGDFRLVPVITIILNFSRTRWSKARSLKELVQVGHPEITDHMKDYDVEIYDVLYLDEAVKSRFTSDFRDVVTVLSEGKIDKKHNFRKLKYPVDALDMIYAYTKDERYRNIRNEVIKKEMKGEVISMSEFLDELEKNKTIEIAGSIYRGTRNKDTAIQVIEYGLKISTEEAQKIFDTEVLRVALA